MEAQNLVTRSLRWGGYANIVGGVLVAVAYLSHPHHETPEIIAGSYWLWTHVLFVFSLFNLIIVGDSFSVMPLIALVFTGMIIIDAIFFIISIARGHEFNTLAFEASIVISLIFARFALFANNILAYSLSTLGVAFATGSLLLLTWSQQKELAKEY